MERGREHQNYVPNNFVSVLCEARYALLKLPCGIGVNVGLSLHGVQVLCIFSSGWPVSTCLQSGVPTSSNQVAYNTT